MSGTLAANPPIDLERESDSVELGLEARPRDLGGFSVRRALPSALRRLVGPFIFFDHFGPAQLAAGTGLDVRPHPHIGLATVTYLFEGEIIHRDNLGSVQAIRPGDINWMLAGRGIVHSERSGDSARRAGPHLHGIQCWVALPLENEEDAPVFAHHGVASLPIVRKKGAVLDVLAGTAFGARSPVAVLSPTLYLHGRLDPGARLTLDEEHPERAVYVAEGAIRCDGRIFPEGTMAVLRGGRPVEIEVDRATRVMILGGAPLHGERHVFWNFVSSSLPRLERAKDDWQNERFATIPGDDQERIPLPPAR